MLESMIAEQLAKSDQHIAIAGSGGWIGLATLELLEQALGDSLSQRVSCYGSTARTLTLRSGRTMEQRPLPALLSLEPRRIWLLHFAFLTKDRAETMSDADYRAANNAISTTVLQAATHLPVEAMFVASSGAATRANDPTASPAMRLYGQMKLDDETRFADWSEQYGRRAVIGRIFNITGPYINKHQAYAIANFITDALERRPIAVRAPRQVFRAYVAIRELMSLAFALMGAERQGVARFDTGGAAMELGDVAQAVADILDAGPVERANITETMPDQYAGNDMLYADLLRRHGITPVLLDEQIAETADYMRHLVT
jgi:UDP-glucuronate decarboxylase